MDYGPIAVVLVVIVISLAWLMSSRSGQQSTRRINRSQPSLSLSPQQYREHWQRIEQLIEMPGTDATKSAILEADKLVDTALRQKGFSGQTMGDRLKDARAYFGNNAVYQGLWQAHKMRNALAHELSFDLPKQIAKQHLDQFKAALQQLGVL